MDVRELGEGAFWHHLGMEVVALPEGSYGVRLQVTPQHLQIMGRVHGGVLASVLDSAMALAVHQDLPPGSAAATLNLHVDYLRPVALPAVLVGRGRVLAQSRTVALVEAQVEAEGQGMVARGSAAYRLYPAVPLPARDQGGPA
jgi:uncharacterized protein (TIGR00369 family)